KSPHRLRSTWGPFSRYFWGSHVCQTCDGSTTWSSTLMIFGSSSIGSQATANLTPASVFPWVEDLGGRRHAEHPVGVAHDRHGHPVGDVVGVVGVAGERHPLADGHPAEMPGYVGIDGGCAARIEADAEQVDHVQ